LENFGVFSRWNTANSKGDVGGQKGVLAHKKRAGDRCFLGGGKKKRGEIFGQTEKKRTKKKKKKKMNPKKTQWGPCKPKAGPGGGEWGGKVNKLPRTRVQQPVGVKKSGKRKSGGGTSHPHDLKGMRKSVTIWGKRFHAKLDGGGKQKVPFQWGG